MDTSFLVRDTYKLILQRLPHIEIYTNCALVSKGWNRLAYEVLREIGLNLLRDKVLKPGQYGTKADFKLISWTIDSETVTAYIISKFLRGNATELSLLKVIRVAKPLIVDDEVIINALHARRSSHVIKALAINNPETTRRCILDALHDKNRPVLQAILDPDTPKFSEYFPDSMTWMETRTSYFSALDLLKSMNNPNEIIRYQQIIKPRGKFSFIKQFSESVGSADKINIEHLDLRKIEFKNLDDYVSIKDNFPYLKTLYINDTFSKMSHIKIFNLLCLENLTICSKHLEEFSDFDNLVHLTKLSLKKSPNLKKFSGDIKYLKKLSFLDLYACKSLKELPDEIRYLENLEILDLRFTGLCAVPDLTKNTSLKELRIEGCLFAKEPHLAVSITHLLEINPNLQIDLECQGKF